VINGGGPYESARNNMLALDFATQVGNLLKIHQELPGRIT
jgi:hypothetical protein